MPAMLGHWFSDRRTPAPVQRDEHTAEVLVDARVLVDRGWLQGAWYVLESPNGRRHVVLPGSFMPRREATVVGSCLVGAVIEAARTLGRERDAVGPTIDALWEALLKAEGRPSDDDRRTPSLWTRRVRVRELTRWNDHHDRTQDDVLRLLDLAIHRADDGARSAIPDDLPPDPWAGGTEIPAPSSPDPVLEDEPYLIRT
jgi:hypothetical protein